MSSGQDCLVPSAPAADWLFVGAFADAFISYTPHHLNVMPKLRHTSQTVSPIKKWREV
jgi:hypothetical protein